MRQFKMMAGALVKNPYCSKCGEDARPHAQFCFACGGAVVSPEREANEDEVSSEWFKGDIVSGNNEEASLGANPNSGSLVAIPKPEIDVQEQVEEQPTKVRVKEKKKKPETAETKPGKKLRSASDLKKNRKPTRYKQVELVWEEPAGKPNWLFLSLGLALVILAALVVYLAIYLK